MEIFVMSAAGIYDWPIIKQVSWLLGQVMNGIYNALSAIGIENIGVAIIVFTIIVYTLLLPLTIKQQKFTKMSAVMQPEIQKIQKRYANKKDQASMLKQQEEMNMVYDKYGLKMSSGCLPSLLQLAFAYPSEAGGVGASAVKFLGVFAPTQIPLAVIHKGSFYIFCP